MTCFVIEGLTEKVSVVNQTNQMLSDTKKHIYAQAL